VQATANPTIKAKHIEELKKEIKKLQKYFTAKFITKIARLCEKSGRKPRNQRKAGASHKS
jgi:hypothetical protein